MTNPTDNIPSNKEELEKALENLAPEEKLEFLKNLNKMIEEINGAVGEYLEKAEA